MDLLKQMKENLIANVQGQMSNLHQADCKELGAAVDMIKDLSEAIYYCSVTEAMESSDKEKSNAMRYTYPPVMYNGYGTYMNSDQMYYNGGN